MPWTHTATDMRTRFIADYQNELFSFAELCSRYDISRKTGYKWVNRYRSEGPGGLDDRSHATHTCPHETDARVRGALLRLRRLHPTWGAKKLLQRIAVEHPAWDLPALSTAHDLLKRHGLVKRRRRRAHRPHAGRPTTVPLGPNDLWTADFKGQFRMGNGRYCYPLTVADAFSRFVLGCKGMPSIDRDQTRASFELLFRTYGLPQRIRTDNGAPFASLALGRLSRLSVWLIRLGIRPELIQPGCPQQNGAHERMHRTLKAEATRPPASSLRSQQHRFDAFRDTFNRVRPHEALDQRTPASQYHASPRPFPQKLPPLDYPPHFEVRLVSNNGGIRWRNHWVSVSSILRRERVGLEAVADGLWTVYFGPLELGRLDERSLRITDLEGHQKRHPHRTRRPRAGK